MRRRNESTRKGDETGVATGEREPTQMTSARSSDAALLRRWRKTARANDPSESVHELWRGLTGIKNAEAGSSGGRQGYQSQPRTAHRGRYALKGTKTSREAVRPERSWRGDGQVPSRQARVEPGPDGSARSASIRRLLRIGCRRSRAWTPRRKRSRE
jgi:hypothetical protein